jgi:hypothetical protein
MGKQAMPKNQRMSTEMPVTLGTPVAKVSIMPRSASQAKRPVKAWPEKSGAIQLSATASRMPRIWVDPPVAHLSPTSVSPRR